MGNSLWDASPYSLQFNGVDGQVFPPVMASYAAVKLYGPGHVVAYNYIADFHDGINVETYGNLYNNTILSETPARRRTCTGATT